MTEGAKKILVIGPSWVGDMVMAQSLFITLRRRESGCRIDVLAPAWSFPLLDRMPEVSKAIEMPLTHGQFAVQARIRLGKQLRNERYDQVIVLPNSWKSALIPFFADIPVRTGYLGELRWGLLNDARRLDKKKLTMTVQRFVALALPADAPQPPECPVPSLAIDSDRQQAVRDKFNLNDKAPILALCPGAEYGPAKRWPAEHYAELAQCKLAQGWSVWLFGSGKDQAVAARINQLSGDACRDFSGQTSLAEAVDLMSLVDVVVSNDSGLMHVAAALDKKLIALYGSSDPGFTPPLNSRAKVVDLRLDCSPCFARECPLGHTDCLTQITPAQVLAEIG
ncbi:lipopolysaccharide heptosyltransferase II [Methylomarinum sp. Ch1-1]|uniref:lipopolysaccharide heptosyltransferase II n=1 Tax=Methylomarinum roseum TaxID=3067653 RepID=A0AAU7NWL0_9GAMM